MNFAEIDRKGQPVVSYCRHTQDRTNQRKLALFEGKVLVVGDSQVKGLGRVFCARDSKRRMCVCLPGAGVGDVSARLGGALASEGVVPTVVFSVGGNDVGRVRDEELVRRYRVALGKVRDLREVPVVCGVLPRKYDGGAWLTKACAL